MVRIYPVSRCTQQALINREYWIIAVVPAGRENFFCVFLSLQDGVQMSLHPPQSCTLKYFAHPPPTVCTQILMPPFFFDRTVLPWILIKSTLPKTAWATQSSWGKFAWEPCPLARNNIDSPKTAHIGRTWYYYATESVDSWVTNKNICS